VRILRFRHDQQSRTGVIVDAGSTTVADLGDTDPITLLAAGPDARAAAVAAAVGSVALDTITLLTPLPRPPKFLAIGLNYTDHCAETGMAEPDFPVFFNKQTTCIVGPGDPIHVPRASAMVDYECELAVVIGRRCRHVPAARAHEVIAGYTVVNDVTVRDWQLRAPTMTIGKSFDTHGPVGPWIVTADEIPDPQHLALRTWVNGELLQDGSTADMIFTCAQQIETLSTSFTLEPGDLIATGTPAGVGLMRQPPRWLVPGDTVAVEVERVGRLENPVVAEPADTAVI
jgi:2-keto-4-pentenoate hydratase/2-oxohepta-3-ene-1,7-dioic acid hydratase in catechol pathway